MKGVQVNRIKTNDILVSFFRKERSRVFCLCSIFVGLISFVTGFGQSTVLYAQVSDLSLSDAAEIVNQADAYRGDLERQFSFKIDVIETEDDALVSQASLDVYVNNENPYATISVFRDANTQKGTKLLQNEARWWLHKPGTRNAIRISPAQRLLGSASYADVSATNFRKHYSPSAIELTKLGKIEAYKIVLDKKNSGAAYQYIHYFISRDKSKPIKAEFYSTSKRLLKTMYFRKFSDTFGLTLSTEWVIVDSLNTKKITLIKVQNFSYQRFSPRIFDPDLLVDTTL